MSKSKIKRIVILSAVFSLTAGCATSTRLRAARMAAPSKLPDLDHVMEAFVPIEDLHSYDLYLSQLRRDVAVPIRELQQKSVIGWFGFLIHDCPSDLLKDGACIQLWLERGSTVKDDVAFRALLPKHFLLVRPSRPN